MAETKGISCPICSSTERRILEYTKRTGALRRRCVCAACDQRYTTYEYRGLPRTSMSDGARLIELFRSLLANRYRTPDGVIIDCLALALLLPVGRRIQWQELAEMWNCMDRQSVSSRIGAIRTRGLADYDRGSALEPGYLIRRVGPA